MTKTSFQGGSAPYFSRKRYDNQNKGLRKNERIRSPQVRVIGPDGRQIGILPTSEALQLAKNMRLDLVEISASAHPPVCRILEFGKYMYEESKKSKQNKAHTTKLKEVKFRMRIEKHDYLTKIRHAEEFLYHGDKVKLSLTFRGREREHEDFGFATIQQAMEDLAHMGIADTKPRMVGRNIIMILAPVPQQKRRRIYTLHKEESATEK